MQFLSDNQQLYPIKLEPTITNMDRRTAYLGLAVPHSLG